MGVDTEEKEKAKEETPEVGTQKSSTMETDDLVEEKLRALVENNQADFGAWTSLISEIEKTSPHDLRRICMAYDSFLSEFPLCYGYWKKYASLMAYLCTLNEVEEVYERAVQAAAYSVDLWVSYCSFGVLAYEDPADVRRLFERGLTFVGKDYSCHLLWDKYIEFEYSQKQWSRLAHIYINTLRFPTKKLNSYYESLKTLVAIWEEEMGCENNSTVPPETVSNCEMTDVKACEYAEISNVIRDLLGRQGGHPRPNTVKKYLLVGELLYHKSSQIDKMINCYEARIKRPYFHVKPFDDCQLENWHRYLDFVEMKGDFDWTVKLYERCLIPCANYSEFWIRYVEFVDSKGGREIAIHALDRALTVFFKRVPAFHLYCSMFKEKIGDVVGARAPFLRCGIDLDPEFIGNVHREANMEKRMGNTEAARMVYEKAIEMAKAKQNLQILSILYTNFARFTFVVSGSVGAAIEVFTKGILQVPCKSIIQELINFTTLHGGAGQIPKLDSIVANAIVPESDVSQALNSHDREEISRLFLEFVDLYGTIYEIRNAWDHHRKLFPHIMRSITCQYSPIETNPLVKSVEGRKQMLVPSPHQACGDNDHDALSTHLLDSQSPKNNNDILSEGIVMDKLQEEDIIDAKVREELVEVAEVVEKQSIPEGTELHEEAKESAHECHDVAQIPESTPEYPKIDNQVRSYPELESGDDLRQPALENLSINSPDNETRQSNPTASHDHNIPQEATSREGENELQDEGNSDEVSAIHVPDPIHMKPSTPSQANLLNRDSPMHSVCDSTPPESRKHMQLQMQDQAQTNVQQALPVNVAYSQNASSGENWAKMYYVQSSQPQQWQVHSQMQYTPAGTTNPPMVVAQGYPYQSQAWTSTQDQQANQSLGQYQMAAAQVYPISNLTWPGQSVQQQAYAYAQPQSSTQPTAQPQTQVYQQSLRSNEQQYGYAQSDQGIPPHIWQYYQHQWYYLQQQQQQQQQQQNQQLLNNPKQEQKIEQLQQMNPQQQLQNQQPLSQQQQQQNLQQPSQQEQQQQQLLSPQQDQSQHQQQQQQQQLAVQQQNQQVHNAQQHQHLLYLQQQQQQLYLQQQQQLYLQQQQLLQQQQFQQLPQQQQQLVLQQQQQLLLQQQQQQLLQLQHQQLQQQPLQLQQQQQISASELKALSGNFYLQQSLPVQQNSGNQNGQEYSEQAITSQGEGARVQTAEQSGSSFSSHPQASPNQ